MRFRKRHVDGGNFGNLSEKAGKKANPPNLAGISETIFAPLCLLVGPFSAAE